MSRPVVRPVIDLPFPRMPGLAAVHSEVADLRIAGRYVPAGNGSEPIAGDFFDVVALAGGLVAVAVGDVAGHGVEAAERMLGLRTALRAAVAVDPAPAAVLTELDAVLSRRHVEEMATLWFGLYDPATGALRYGSAGHPPPLVCRPGAEVTLLQEATSSPLGSGMFMPAFQTAEVTLPVEALLVAYSDGLVERREHDLEAQIARLRDTVTQAVASGVARTEAELADLLLDAFVPDPARARDDVCVVVVARR